MDLVEQRYKRIRDLVNRPWKQQGLLEDRTKWNKLCASMDVIGDTQIAINSYFSLPNFKAENGGYLFLYGLLQAFFLQQDAINHLSEALFDTSINWKKDYPDIYLVRELRNDSIGHPTKRGRDESFHFIARYSVSKAHFRLMSHYSKNNTSEFNNIDINELRTKQKNSVIKFLDTVIELMEKERENVKTEVNASYRVMNFGESKGLSFDRVLIYPTKPILKWLVDNHSELAPTSRSKLYVALTRARYSVAIIYDYADTLVINGVQKWK